MLRQERNVGAERGGGITSDLGLCHFLLPLPATSCRQARSSLVFFVSSFSPPNKSLSAPVAVPSWFLPGYCMFAAASAAGSNLWPRSSATVCSPRSLCGLHIVAAPRLKRVEGQGSLPLV